MSYFERHIFFCTNKRGGGKASCEDCGASALRAHAKERVKALGLTGKGGVRVNSAGCLDRCEYGPVAVVYPEGVWYTYVDESDIDEIVETHLRDGQIVDRLQIVDWG